VYDGGLGTGLTGVVVIMVEVVVVVMDIVVDATGGLVGGSLLRHFPSSDNVAFLLQSQLTNKFISSKTQVPSPQRSPQILGRSMHLLVASSIIAFKLQTQVY